MRLETERRLFPPRITHATHSQPSKTPCVAVYMLR